MPSPSFHVRHFSKVITGNFRKRAVSYSVCTVKDINYLINKTSLLNLRDSAVDLTLETDTFGGPSPPHTSSMVTPSLFSSPIHASSSRIPNFQNSNVTLYKYVDKIQKERRFGSSDVENIHKTKAKKISPKKRLRRQSFKRNYRIFSTSVTPCETTTQKSLIESHIYRLSGISMSPMSPISWSAQSPVHLDTINSKLSFFSKTTPPISDEDSHIFAKPLESESKLSSTESRSSVNSSAGSSQRLQISCDSCPPNKLYFWRDDVSELITDDKLGRGGFGQVYQGTYRGQKVAIKKMQTAFRHKKAVYENFLGEVLSLRLNHRNLVRSLVLVQPPNSPLTPGSKGTSFLVMEYGGSRNLLQIINAPEEMIDSCRRCKICCDVLRGLDYLHGKGLAHLDFKPGNILITDSETCKLCDFGSCKLVCSPRDSFDDLSGMSSVSEFSDTSSPPSCESNRFSFSNSTGQKQESLLMGTLMYRAPELLRGGHPSTSADIYSYGITAWQVWQRCDPYPGLHPHTAVFGIVAFGRRPPVPEIRESGDLQEQFDLHYSEDMKSCWSGDSSVRPTAETVLNRMVVWLEKFKK